MKRVIFVWVLLMSLLVMALPCRAQWAVRIRGIGAGPDTEDVVKSIKPTRDGGYIAAGVMSTDIWVVRLDAHGAVVWQKTYGTLNDYGNELEDAAYSVQQTVDGGFIVAGKSGMFRFWILRLDADGGIVWQKIYKNNLHGARSIQQTADGGFIVAGQGVGESGDISLIKLYGDGNVEWEKTYGGSSIDSSYKVQQTTDGGYILSGKGGCFTICTRGEDFFVLKLDAAGAIVWQKNYGGMGSEQLASITQTADGGYIVAGVTYSDSTWGTDLLVLKLDPQGGIAWQNTYAGNWYEYVESIRQSTDGGYVLAGSTSVNSSGAPQGVEGLRAWVLKLNPDGTHAWDKTYGDRSSASNSIEQTADGGYILGGWIADGLWAYKDFFILKLDADGDIPGCSTVGQRNIATVYPVSTVALNTNVTAYTRVSTVINSSAVIKTPTYQHSYLCMVANHPPVLNPVGNKTVSEGQLLEFGITATDFDGDTLAYCASNLPSGANFDPSSRRFSWIPEYAQAGNYDVLFGVTDNRTPPMNDSETVTVTVGNVNRPPVVNPVGDKAANEGKLLQFTVTASDPDGDALDYAAGNLPNGATFDPVIRAFSWTPTYDQAGNYPQVRFTVTDNGLPPASASQAITITVGNVNRPPILNPIGNKTVSEGELLEFPITATDPDEDALTCSASNLPAGATFDPATQKFRWTPTYDQAGTYSNIGFDVMDSGSPAEVDAELITITVGNVNRAPVFTPVGTQEVLENHDLRFFVTATDYEGDAIAYTTGTLPGGASFDPMTGLFSWRPDYSQSGTFTVVFFATDAGVPGMTGQMETAIIVGDVPTPCESADRIIQAVVGLNFPKAVENSYMANLKKVCGFVEEGKITPAINQLNAFINKVNTDMQKGVVGSEIGNKLITMAIGVINTLGN